MCTIEFDHSRYMAAVVARMNSARPRLTLYTITKARLCKECHELSNTSNLIKRIVNNGRVLDVVTELFLKRNIQVVKKCSLASLHILLWWWRSLQSCVCVQTIGDSILRGFLGTIAKVFLFLREEIRQRRGVALLSKIDLFFSLLFRISPAFSLFFKSAMSILFVSDFWCPPFLLCSPQSSIVKS